MFNILSQNIYKILTLVILLSVFLFVNQALAITNTQSLDLESVSSQYGLISDASQTGLDITGDITLEAWVKIESLDNTGGVSIIHKADAYSDAGYELNLQNKSTNDYRIWGQFCQNAYCTTVTQKTGTTNLYNYIGQWVHLAATWEAGVGNEVQLYVNGVEDGDGPVNKQDASSIRNNSSALRIGAVYYNGNTGGFYDGLVDEVRIWNDVRTPTEIADNMLESLDGTESNLVAYWDFNNDAEDKTSNSNNLSLTGSPSYSEEPAHLLMCSFSGLF